MTSFDSFNRRRREWFQKNLTPPLTPNVMRLPPAQLSAAVKSAGIAFYADLDRGAGAVRLTTSTAAAASTSTTLTGICWR